ncbi:hypothetical protein BOTBODRAFT_32971 [Botryobasidium botryosum FD-172 SS1]|uniref:Uncharacterized protein n=1 Tax=Botryobasidium botryosum (strain FD-172 SS1) TaxID=930990 RepID=A0A067MRG1_BOTB1|nr:hypothetical protein BOTBODRAFT_32971 [Botryobasidium botryosum FD-172 SS1]
MERQDANQTHALNGAYSTGTAQRYSVVGGNSRIFEEFLVHSKATIHFGTRILNVCHGQNRLDRLSSQPVSASTISPHLKLRHTLTHHFPTFRVYTTCSDDPLWLTLPRITARRSNPATPQP